MSGRVPFGVAFTYAKMNRRSDAREVLKDGRVSRPSYTPGDAIAHAHVVLQEHEDAIRELGRARDERSSSLHTVGISPEFAPLRSDKRFLSLLREIGLEPKKVFAVNQAARTE